MRKLKKEVWPHQVCLPQIDLAAGQFLKVEEDPGAWCRTHVGRRFQDWYSYLQTDGRVIYAFKDPQMALFFKLLWSGR